MRGAPPVQMAVGRDARWLGFCLMLSVLAGATVAAWLCRALHEPDLGAALAAIAGAGLAGVVVRPSIPAESSGALVWDGQQWTLHGMPGAVDVMVDLGGWMLLRFRSASAVRWVPLTLPRDGLYAACRAALFAHAGRQAGSASGHSHDEG